MSEIRFDADSIKQRIKDRLRSKSSWAKILYYSANQRIIDAVAEEFAYLMLNDEILTVEGKWNLARQRSSLMAENKFFNYFPYRKKGARGFLKVSTSKTFDKMYGVNVPLEKYKTFSNNNYNFCIAETTILSTIEQYKNVEIVQGNYREVQFTAQGLEKESFTVINDSIDNDIFDVIVNNETYTKVDYLRDAASKDDKIYTIENLIDFSGVKITFGNDYFGKKLRAGDTVVFKYIETDGSKGNVESSNNITTVISSFEDSNGNPVDLFCTNDEAIVGGVDYEDIESIRDKAPRSYKSGNVAIIKDDYKSICESFSFVKKTTVWGEAEINEDNNNDPGTYIEPEENLVYICCISSSDGSITRFQEKTIRAEINEKKSPTDIVRFVKPSIIYVKFNVNAYIIDKNFTIVRVVDSIDEKLKSDFSIDNLDFKKSIYQSNYITSINSVPGVGFHSTTFSLYSFLKFSSAYVFSGSLSITQIKPNTVKIYVNDITGADGWLLLGQDDGSGLLFGVEDYTLSASSINYDTGEINCLVTNGLTATYSNYSIRVNFEVDNENIEPLARNQIISCGDNVINVSYV